MIKNTLFKKLIILSLFLAFFVPIAVVHAQQFQGVERTTSCTDLNYVDKSQKLTIANFSACVVDLITKAFVPYIFALTVLALCVGIFNYVKNADNESARTESLRLIVWSLVGLLFMVGVWSFAAMFAQFWGQADAPNNLIIPQFKDQ